MEGLLNTGADRGVLHGHFPWLVQALEWVAAGIDIAAVLLLIIGALRFLLSWARVEVGRDNERRVRGLNRERMELGRYILAGLELLIVSDIIRTALTFELGDLLFLGLLVVIRAVVSIFLDREMEELRGELKDDPSKG